MPRGGAKSEIRNPKSKTGGFDANGGDADEQLLIAEAITKDFKMGSRILSVLKGIDLIVEKGEIVVLAGPSGAGKSTLLHIMGALDVPTSGIIRFSGESVFDLSRKSRSRLRNRKIGFIFQFFHLLPEFTAWENVIIPLRIRGGGENNSRPKLKERACQLLGQVGLGGRADHFPSQLSGGERQRVAVARALANDPPLILADEPTGNLDTRASADLLRLFSELHRRTGKTFILVSHDQQVADWAPRLLRIRDGLLVGG